MDINKIINRVKNILLTPKTEWPVIADETATVSDLYKNWIVWLAAIPALASFVKGSLIGYGGFGITVRSSISGGLTGAVIGYALSLVLVYVLALVIDALAPNFSGQKNPVQALKTAAYAWTAAWVAGIGQLVPWLGMLILSAGAIYSLYLLYLGLPSTMKCPPDKAAGYTALIFVCALVLNIVVIALAAGTTGAGMWMSGSANDSQTTFDKNSWLGKMEAADKEMEAAQKSGDADAQSKAEAKMLGAALGGGDQVEALAPEALKPLVPETLAGLARTDFSASRNGAMGMQISQARATYSDGNGHALSLEISDSGSMKGLIGLAGWAAVQNDQITDHGYDKTYKQNGRLTHEQWDNASRSGTYGIVVGERFSVKASGKADSIDTLKAAVMSLDLKGLEALKNQGVKKN